MKRFILALVVILGLFSCESKDSNNINASLVNNPVSADGINKGTSVPAIKFEKTDHDFGKILQGEQVSYTFKFKNVGDAPLIITSIEKTCGCTSPEYSNQPIKPGESGKITITYDSKGHKGFQNKRLVVKANTNPSETILRIKAQVENINTF
jgi:hypothetical protein